MSNLSVFAFEGHEVRFVGTEQQPEWVANDVISALYPFANQSSYGKYLEKIPAEWKGKKKILTPGGNQSVSTVLEPGLYHLICRSNSPKAIAFQKWIYEEVLPTIRKTGSYSLPESQPSGIDGIKSRITNLWTECEGAEEVSKKSRTSALHLARLCGEALLEAKRMVGHGNWEKFRETIKHPRTGETMPSSTATLYQRIAESWDEIENSGVSSLRGATIKLRKNRTSRQLKPGHETHSDKSKKLAFPPSIQQAPTLEMQQFRQQLDELERVISMAEKVGGFTEQQRVVVRDRLFVCAQDFIIRCTLRDRGIDPDATPESV